MASAGGYDLINESRKLKFSWLFVLQNLDAMPVMTRGFFSLLLIQHQLETASVSTEIIGYIARDRTHS